MSSEHTNPFRDNAVGADNPSRNSSATAKNRRKSPSILNDNFSSSSKLLASSPLHFDWQSNRSCVSERIRSLFANTTLADVFFNIHYQVGSDGSSTPFAHQKSPSDRAAFSASTDIAVQRIPAHTFVLAISSAVFEAMFYGPMSVQRSVKAATAANSEQTHSRNAEQSIVKHSSWPPSLVASALQSNLLEPEKTDTLSDANTGSTDWARNSFTQPPIFNPSSSQITTNNPTEIYLDDVNPVAFTNILRFIYTDEIQIDHNNVLQTLYVAKKYAINVMENACVDFLSQAITVDNAFMLLGQANFFDEYQLAKNCLEVIDKNTAKAFDTEDFLAVDGRLLCSILERDTLCIVEVRLFVAVIKWAKAEYYRRFCDGKCSSSVAADSPPGPAPPTTTHSLTEPGSAAALTNISSIPIEALQEILEPLLPLIRFPLMSIEEFANVVVPTGVLSDSIVVKIFQHFLASKPVKPELPYITRPRCFSHGLEEIVRRFVVVDQRWDYRGTSDRIRFKVDRKIYVVGFGLYGSIHGESEYEASIEIVHPESGVVLGSNNVTYQADGSPDTFRVAFKEPIPLAPNVNYLASATIKGQDTYYGTRGRREIIHECSSGGRVTFQFSYAACMNNGTSVEDGQIPEIIFVV